MSEQFIKHPFSEAPLSSEQLLPASAVQQLYNIYTDRISDFSGFRQRPFKEARADFIKTIQEAQDDSDIEFIRSVVNLLITPSGYRRFKDDIGNYWQAHNLEEDLESYSYCILTNHRFFSDLPIAAAAVRDLRQNDTYAASRNLMVTGKMIPGMELDLFDNGDYAPVVPLLSMIARQVQTVPKLPDDSTDAMVSQRRVWNDEAKVVMSRAASSPGNILFIAGSGSHDEVSHNGQRLTMQSLNDETAKLLSHPRLKIIPLFFSCDSFGAKGLVPAEPKYRLLDPVTLQKPEETIQIMQELAHTGTELLRDEFPRGVHYEANFRESVRKVGNLLTRRGRED